MLLLLLPAGEPGKGEGDKRGWLTLETSDRDWGERSCANVLAKAALGLSVVGLMALSPYGVGLPLSPYVAFTPAARAVPGPPPERGGCS